MHLCQIIIILLTEFYICYGSVNLALNQPASQSSVFRNGNQILSAERAVDGKYDTNQSSLTCAVTQGNAQEVFWQVRLNQTSVIRHIHFVFESTTRIQDILQNHRVYVSQSSKFKSGHLCYQESRDKPGLINDVYCLQQGQYVTYYTNHLYDGEAALLLLCEVEVYGCPLGQYGRDCAFKCSNNCDSQPCEPDFGHCVNGCSPGFVGERCNAPCDIGWYGTGCALQCSSTCLNNDCVNTNGTCKTCVPGFNGDMCEISTIDRTATSGETEMDIGNNNVKFIIVIGIMGTVIIALTVIAIYTRIKYRKSKQLSTQADNCPIYHDPGKESGNFPRSAMNLNTVKSCAPSAIYHLPSTNYVDAKSRTNQTLPYANERFQTDPALTYEPLQRDGIYPRESRHIYDPIQS